MALKEMEGGYSRDKFRKLVRCEVITTVTLRILLLQELSTDISRPKPNNRLQIKSQQKNLLKLLFIRTKNDCWL